MVLFKSETLNLFLLAVMLVYPSLKIIIFIPFMRWEVFIWELETVKYLPFYFIENKHPTLVLLKGLVIAFESFIGTSVFGQFQHIVNHVLSYLVKIQVFNVVSKLYDVLWNFFKKLNTSLQVHQHIVPAFFLEFVHEVVIESDLLWLSRVDSQAKILFSAMLNLPKLPLVSSVELSQL